MRSLLRPLVLFLASSTFAQPQLVSPPFEAYRATLVGETFSIGNGLSAGKPNDDIMYAVTAKGSVYTLRESDGSQLNLYTRGDVNATSSSRLDWDRDGEIGVYAERNNVIVMDAAGNFVEEFSVDGVIVGQPIIHLGKIFVSHFDQAFSGINGLVTVYSLDFNTVEAQFTLSGTRPGPCGKNSDIHVYFGTDQGELIGINVETLVRTEYTDSFGEDMTGTPFATPDDTAMLIQSQEGICYISQGATSQLYDPLQCNDGISGE